MSNPNFDSRYAKPSDVSAAIASQATTDAGRYAPLASPVFTGTPSAPTPSVGDNSTAVATTSFVATAVLKNNYTATTDPTVSSDTTAGYDVGSRWVNTTSKVAYMCISSSAGAAVWQRLVPDVQKFTSSGTWTKPAWATLIRVTCIGPGAGGSSGALQASGSACSGGAGGGGGGVSYREIPAAQCNATETVTVGTGGAGGAAQATSSTAGNSGSNGSGPTLFGLHMSAGRGFSGGGGALNAASTAGFGGSAGFNGGNGAAGTNGAAGSQATLLAGAAAGGSGGGISTTPAQFAGGPGSQSTQANFGTPAAGTAGGGAGASGTNALGDPAPGSSGAGGGSNISGNGGAGGAGGNYGAGGGGGGSALNGSISGAGGAGANGIVVVVSQ